MPRPANPKPKTARTAAPAPVQDAPKADSAQVKLTAFTDFVAALAATASGSKREIRRDRLQEDIKLLVGLDRSVIPLGLILAASSSLSPKEVTPFLTRLSGLLVDDLRSALDRVSETILMVDDPDIRASAVIATSVLIQRTVPADVGMRDRLLVVIMELVDAQLRTRRARHGALFAALRHVEKAPILSQLPGLLSEVSDALEDLACERDVFRDNPIDLVPETPVEVESPLSILKTARVQSGASLPPLNEELAQLAALGASLGWSEDRGFEFLTSLYRHQAMDTKPKSGLSLSELSKVMADVSQLLGAPVRDLAIDEDRTVTAPYSYDIDAGKLTLNVGFRGGLSVRVVEQEHPNVLETLRQIKADREATILSRAVDRWRSARAAAGGGPIPEEEEAAQIDALAAFMKVPPAEAYDALAAVYGARRGLFSADPRAGISLGMLRRVLEAASERRRIVRIGVDAQTPAIAPFRVEGDPPGLILNTVFEELNDQVLEQFLKEWAVEPIELPAPDEGALDLYQSAKEPGSATDARNIERFIDEFGLSREHARDAFHVLFESAHPFWNSLSIETLRTVVATVNARFGPGAPIDIVTGWCRDLPGTNTADRFSVGWLTVHSEEGTSLRMLTFNLSYGEGKKSLPPLSNDLLLEWSRHYRAQPGGAG